MVNFCLVTVAIIILEQLNEKKHTMGAKAYKGSFQAISVNMNAAWTYIVQMINGRRPSRQ
jgi:hypothetical protein